MCTQTSPNIQTSLVPSSMWKQKAGSNAMSEMREPGTACLNFLQFTEEREGSWLFSVPLSDCISNTKIERVPDLENSYRGEHEKMQRQPALVSDWGLDGDIFISEDADRKGSWVQTDTVPLFFDIEAFLSTNPRFMTKPLEERKWSWLD